MSLPMLIGVAVISVIVAVAMGVLICTAILDAWARYDLRKKREEEARAETIELPMWVRNEEDGA